MNGEGGGGGGRGSIALRAVIVGAGTIASRVLGAARDSVMAAFLAADATDAFVVAFTIPNALRQILGEGAASAAVVPIFTQVKEQDGFEAARTFYGKLRGAMALVLLLVAVAGVAAGPWLAWLYAPGYASVPGKLELTGQLTRVVFPYIFFMGMAATGAGALQAMGRFAVPSFAPMLLNVAMIAAPFAFAGVAAWLGLPLVGAFAVGALVGGFLQLAAQWPALARVRLAGGLRLDLRDPRIRQVAKLMAPLLAGMAVYQINLALSRLLASYLPAGSQSFLYYGSRIVEIPQGVFALAIGTAALPSLAALHARGEIPEMKRTFAYALRLSMFVALPATVAILVLAEPIVVSLYARGHFGREMVVETARSLVWQASAVWVVSAIRQVLPVFYAAKDTRTPVLASALSLLVYLACGTSLMGPMGHAGLALAVSIGVAAQLVFLLVGARWRLGLLGLRSVGVSCVRQLGASAVMGAAAWGVARLGDWSRGGTLHNVLVLGAAVTAGGLVYAATAYLFRVPELRELLDALRRRRARRAGPASPPG